MTFQVSNYKGRNFLDLNNNKEQDICLTSTKEEAWAKTLWPFKFNMHTYHEISHKSHSYRQIQAKVLP